MKIENSEGMFLVFEKLSSILPNHTFSLDEIGQHIFADKSSVTDIRVVCKGFVFFLGCSGDFRNKIIVTECPRNIDAIIFAIKNWIAEGKAL